MKLYYSQFVRAANSIVGPVAVQSISICKHRVPLQRQSLSGKDLFESENSLQFPAGQTCSQNPNLSLRSVYFSCSSQFVMLCMQICNYSDGVAVFAHQYLPCAAPDALFTDKHQRTPHPNSRVHSWEASVWRDTKLVFIAWNSSSYMNMFLNK